MSAFTRASDPAVEAVRAWRWLLADDAARTALAARLSQAEPALQLFDDAEAPALLATAWDQGPSAPAELPGSPPPAWVADAQRIASWRANRPEAAACLVVVRQPMKTPDAAAQRDWAATVLRALDGDEAPPEGLLSANFFASRDGAAVYNFAEWTSVEAHRDALRRGSYGQYGSIGASDLWRAAREHPAITPDHEVRRYALRRALARA